MRVTVATCAELPEPDPDEPLLVRALEGAELDVRVVPWDGPEGASAFESSDLVVIRSTWNYFERADEFVAWAHATAAFAPLFNPPAVVAWNTHKKYLVDLDARGVDVVATEYVPRRDGVAAIGLDDICERRGWHGETLVVKPAVSAASFKTKRFVHGELREAQAFLDELTATRDAMVQRWVPSVDTSGERALVWIDGEITHAVRKAARFSGSAEHVSGRMEIAEDERAFAERAIATAIEISASALLYGRVDIVRDGDELRLMELELVEPSLFFNECPPSLERFTASILKRLRR